MKNFGYILAVAFLTTLLWLGFCTRQEKLPDPITTSDTIWLETPPETLAIEKPVPYAVFYPETVPVYIPVECESLWREYAATYFYFDTLKNDSLAFIALHDTVSKNMLAGRSLIYQDKTPTQIINNTTTYLIADKPKYRVYVGPMITYANGSTPGIGGGVLLGSKTFAAGYSYDIVNRQQYLCMYFSLIRGSRGNEP